MRKISLFLLCCLFLLQAQAQNKAQWLEDARFGMFIHWGLYSASEGLWKGERLRHPNNYAEWIQYRNRIPLAEYGQLAKRFDWEHINPEEWVLLAKKAGMKYIIMTAKHHDGVAIWDTQVGDYSLPKLSHSGRDVIKELADACRKHGMKLGFYYSHWIDWEHPYGWNHNQEVTGRVTDAQYNEYWQQKVIPQVRELLTNYGDVALMWFDMWIPYQQSIIKKEQLLQLANLIHNLQPNCLINSRLGLPMESKLVDFETLGDNVFGEAYVDHVWETPGTIAHSWGFNALENEWKSSNQLFQSLINNVSLNGSYTLNIGPRADGSVPFEGVERLTSMGKWLQQYGEALYENKGVKLRSSQHDWGKITASKDGKSLYLHVYNWPLDQVLRVSGILEKPISASLLSPAGKQALPMQQQGPLLHLALPKQAPDPYVSVIQLTFDQLHLDEQLVAESTFGGYALTAKNSISTGLSSKAFDGTKPDHIVLQAGQQATWKLYFAEAGRYTLSCNVHQGEANPANLSIQVQRLSPAAAAPIAVKSKKKNPSNVLNQQHPSLVYQLQAAQNGKVTVEPNENWYVEEFLDLPVGEIQVESPGYVEVHLQSDKPLLFNRIWIAKP